MKFRTWLAGAAVASMAAISTADAGELYVANLSGNNYAPPTGAPYNGTAYFTIDSAATTGTYWFTHNIPANLLAGAQTLRPNGSTKFIFTSLTSPGGPVPTTFLNPAADNPIVRAGALFINFDTTDYPTGAIGGYFTRYTFAAPAGGSRALAPIVGVLNYNAPASPEFNEVLVDLAQVPAANQTDAYDQMSGRTLYAQSVEMLDSMSDFESALLSHANEAAPPLGNFHAFAKGGLTVGKRDGTVDQAGATTSRPFIVAGIDFGFSPTTVAGLAVAYADGRDKFENALGQTNVSTIAGLGYVTANVARVVLQATVGYGQSEIGTTRNMALIGRTAKAIHHGNTWMVAGRISMPYAIDPGTTLSPYVLLDTQHASLDSYTETATSTRAGECDFNIQNYLGYCGGGFTPNDYKDKDFGVELGGMLKASMGPDISARFELGYRQSLDKGGKAIQTLYSGAPIKFNSVILGRSPAAGHAAVALSTALISNMSAEVGYQGYFSGRMQSHMFEARLTMRLF